MIIQGFRVVPLLKRTGQEILSDKVPSLAATTAYYFFFSLFPLLLFMAPLLSFVGDKQKLMTDIMTRASGALPPEALAPLQGVLKDVVFAKSAPGLMSMGALLAAWAGSNIFGALIEALNTAYDVTESRPWWKQQVVRLVVFVIASVIMTLAVVVLLDGTTVVGWVAGKLHLAGAVAGLLGVVAYLLAFALLVALAFLIFKALPNLKQANRHVLVASVFTTILWILATLLFRVYVANFGSFNKTYGTIGGIIALLTWMYYSMFVLLSGGELAAEMHKGTGAIDAAPGATYFGRLVTEAGPGHASRALDPGAPVK
ncbi:MAG: ribonuclease [Gemmatimonadetes bacterium]|nr:ribonuclease [Gemmatimonadota bacterium]